MLQDNTIEMHGYRSYIDPLYADGSFFRESSGEFDAEYKVAQLIKLCKRHKHLFESKRRWIVADVGCGTGRTTFLLARALAEWIGGEILVDGFDVHPNLPSNSTGNIRFFRADFCEESGIYDFVVLFDVVEHIVDPIGFLRAVSQKTKLIALHLPLDDSLFCWVRNLMRKKISFPGHILALNPASAVNLLTMSGIRILDFDYSPAFSAPSGRATMFQRLFFPFRVVSFAISPYLTQQICGGVSFMVLARTRLGLLEMNTPAKKGLLEG